jgi:excisionase family DNA binding protein
MAATAFVPDATKEPTISVERAGASLGISRATAYDAVRRGEIPAIRLGRRWVVPTAQLRRLLGLDPETGDAKGTANGDGL